MHAGDGRGQDVPDMSYYSATIRKWATDNRRAGRLPDADGTGEVGLTSTEAGKRLAVRFALKVELDQIADARYQVFGCGFSMAACAVAADLVIGYNLDEIENIDAKQLNAALEGLPPEREYCAELAVKALQAAAQSAQQGHHKIETSLSGDSEHQPRISANHPVYSTLMNSPRPESAIDEDLHLFACLLTIAIEEPGDLTSALGLESHDLSAIMARYFPDIKRTFLDQFSHAANERLTEPNIEVLSILLSHLPKETDCDKRQAAVWIANIIATRAALPGHLWIAMGLTERPQLTAAIRRHLPSLAAANNQNMRWKRFLYKQVCEQNGGMMCKSPNCGVCSDYSLCFAE